MSDIIDKTKFSRQHIKEIFQSNKLVAETKQNAAKEQTKLLAVTDCETLKTALNQFINEHYYSELKKNENFSPMVLNSRYFHLHHFKNFSDIDSFCGVNFPAISSELSAATKADVTVNLYKRNYYSSTSEHYLEVSHRFDGDGPAFNFNSFGGFT